jgi:hypothetical protein
MNKGYWVAGLTFLNAVGAMTAQGGAVACFESAESLRGMGRYQAVQLCSAAKNSAPAECYLKAMEVRGVSNHEARILCTSAESLAPAECYVEGQSVARLTRAEALRVCTGTKSFQGVFDCLKMATDDARMGRYQAMELCGGASDAAPAQCYIAANNGARLPQNDSLELCRVRDRFRQ